MVPMACKTWRRQCGEPFLSDSQVVRRRQRRCHRRPGRGPVAHDVVGRARCALSLRMSDQLVGVRAARHHGGASAEVATSFGRNRFSSIRAASASELVMKCA